MQFNLKSNNYFTQIYGQCHCFSYYYHKFVVKTQMNPNDGCVRWKQFRLNPIGKLRMEEFLEWSTCFQYTERTKTIQHCWIKCERIKWKKGTHTLTRAKSPKSMSVFFLCCKVPLNNRKCAGSCDRVMHWFRLLFCQHRHWHR